MAKDNDNGLSLAQEKAIEMIIEGYKMADIVKATGYSRKTIWDWKSHNKVFKAELDKRNSEISEFLKRSANKRFEKLQDTAIDVLETLLKDSKNDNVRMETAKEILNRNIGKIPSKLTVTENTEDTDSTGNIIEDIEDWDTEDTIKD